MAEFKAIKAENLTKYYGDFLAVDHINFQVEQGELGLPAGAESLVRQGRSGRTQPHERPHEKHADSEPAAAAAPRSFLRGKETARRLATHHEIHLAGLE